MPSGYRGLRPGTKRASISISGETYEKLRARCKKHGLRIADVIRHVLSDIDVAQPIPLPPRGRRSPRPPEYVEIEVSNALHVEIFEAAWKSNTTIGETLDRALNKMLDDLERGGAS